VVTYTLDYTEGSRILLEEGGEFSDTKHYLYGRECIAEHINANEPANEEWRYYQRDGKNLLRQTSDRDREVTFAWTYSPTGGILLGEKGPVTRLDCGDNAIYDWSTGLIFRNGRYFDPNTGIWITMGAAVTWQLWPQENRRLRRWRRRYGRQVKFFILLLLLFLMATALSGCGCGPVPTPGVPTLPPTAPPTETPPPTMPPTETPPPPPTYTPSPPPTETSTPPPTYTPPPVVTPQPPTPSPVQINILQEEGIGNNPYYMGTARTGTILVNYREAYGQVGTTGNPIITPSAPIGDVHIYYEAPIMYFHDNAPREVGAGGGEYYRTDVWEGLNEKDLYARLVSAERASEIGSGPFDNDRVIEGVAITYVIRNRTEDAYFGPRGGYREQILSIGQFAFTLTHAEGGASVQVADWWADVANGPQEPEIYEHSLRYVIGVDEGWFQDPSHGALYFRGAGPGNPSWFSRDENEWYNPHWP
jgi:hypothetical protein